MTSVVEYNYWVSGPWFVGLLINLGSAVLSTPNFWKLGYLAPIIWSSFVTVHVLSTYKTTEPNKSLITDADGAN